MRCLRRRVINRGLGKMGQINHEHRNAMFSRVVDSSLAYPAPLDLMTHNAFPSLFNPALSVRVRRPLNRGQSMKRLRVY